MTPSGRGTEPLAVSVLPVADEAAWRAFAESILDGERAESHRTMLRRFGVVREHVCFRPVPGGGGLAVPVWEGIGQSAAAEMLVEIVTDPQSEHERYIRDHVIPRIHGVSLSDPPAWLQRIGTTEA